MKRDHPPSGLLRGLEFVIDPNGSPEQALAVIELLDDLRDRIWAHYAFALLTQFREHRLPHHNIEIADPPF